MTPAYYKLDQTDFGGSSTISVVNQVRVIKSRLTEKRRQNKKGFVYDLFTSATIFNSFSVETYPC